VLRFLTLVLAAAALTASVDLVKPAPAKLSVHYRATCGVERWAVKTLTDRAASRINFYPRRTTVSALRRLRPTSTYTRGRGVERRTYRVRARLIEAKLEADQDFHLVIADLRHPAQTMIVEFPDPACTRGAASKRRLQMQNARARFLNACGIPSSSSFESLSGAATISGVGFFDFIHGQTGVAPNGIELHPVLAFSHARCT
jgi:hypothetical protein